MLHAARCTPHDACCRHVRCMLYVVCRTLYVARCMLHAAWRALRAASNVLRRRALWLLRTCMDECARPSATRPGFLPPSAERAQLERARAVGPAAGDRRCASPPDFLRQASGWRRERARPLRGERVTHCSLAGVAALRCEALCTHASLVRRRRLFCLQWPLRRCRTCDRHTMRLRSVHPHARGKPNQPHNKPTRPHAHANRRSKHAPRSPRRDRGRGPRDLARTPIGRRECVRAGGLQSAWRQRLRLWPAGCALCVRESRGERA
jgi:hypothetical protein